jgi:hypothetical protein
VPSSLVFAALVVAWLAVLVPVVARRRQMVPRPAEAHLSARVLARPDRSATTAPVAVVATAVPETRTSAPEAVTPEAVTPEAVTPAAVTPEIVTPEIVAPDAGAPELDGAAADDGADRGDADAAGAHAPEGRVLDRGRGRRPVRDDAGEDEGMDDRDDEGRLATEDYDDEYDDGFGPGAGDADDARPRAYRPGRGGFDADAAAAAAHARYTFRQRVAVGLIAVAVLSLLAALVATPVLWWLHVVTDLGLIGYLVFLRRQTRIEDEVRRRRLARFTGERRALEARRDRQAEHEARIAEVQRWGAVDGFDEHDDHDDLAGHDDRAHDDRAHGDRGHDARAHDDRDHEGLDLDVPAPRWIAPRVPAPAVPDGMELVADSDEHPDFHDLSDSRVPAYRRVATGA